MRLERSIEVKIAGLIAVAVLLSACAVRSRQTAYTYLGRVVERSADVDLAQPSTDPSAYHHQLFGVLGGPIVENLTSTHGTKYQRYTVQLEMGEKISLRSKREDIAVGDCARVWIDGPGVSPVYLYAPNLAQIDKADGCSK